jgi:putative transposase
MTSPQAAAAPAENEKDDPTIWRVDDDLWALLEPVLKVDKPRKKPGRPRRDDRAIFDGLVWLARTGAQWSQLPREFGPKSTAHERFAEWVETGALDRAWAVLLRAYDGEIGLDWAWQAADGCIVKAPFGKKGALARRKPRGATPPTGASRAPSATS